MHTELVIVWRDIDGDDTVNCVIIQGAGGKVFSAGGDFDLIEKNIKDYNALLRTWTKRDTVYNVHQLLQAIVSTMRGPAVGAGLVAGILADVSIALEEGQDYRRPYAPRRRRRRSCLHRLAPALRHGQGQILLAVCEAVDGRKPSASASSPSASRTISSRPRAWKSRPSLPGAPRPDPLHQICAQ